MRTTAILVLFSLAGLWDTRPACAEDRLFTKSQKTPESRISDSEAARTLDHSASASRILQITGKIPISFEPAKRLTGLVARTGPMVTAAIAGGLVPGAKKFAAFKTTKSAATATDGDYTFVGQVSVSEANQPDYVLLGLPSGAVVDNNFVAIGEFTTDKKLTGSTLFVSDKVVYFSDSQGSGAKTISIVLAIILMAASCFCWLCGVPQFYHLIKVAQMLYMKVLLASPRQATILFWLLSGFHMNLFRVVPNPVKINEINGNSCQPSAQFFAEDLSCHVYNTLRNYVLGFLIYLVFYFFIHFNVYDDVDFWKNLKDVTKINMFMLAIFPDVCIGIFGNLASPASNSVLSVGVMMSIALILWYVYIFSWAIRTCNSGGKEAVEFLSHYIFSRSPQSADDPQMGRKIVAIFLEYLKIFIVVIMIGLFSSAPKTQLVIIFLVYILHGIYLLVVRPYVNLFHNILLAVSDIAFFIMVLLNFITNGYENPGKESAIEGGFADAQAAMVAIILLANLIIYLLPLGVGQDVTGSVSPSAASKDYTSKPNSHEDGDQAAPKSALVKDLHHLPKEDENAGFKESASQEKLLPAKMKSSSSKVLGANSGDGSKVSLPPLNAQTRQEEEPMKPKSSENPLINSGTKINKLPPIGGISENPLENTREKDLRASGGNIEAPKINNLLGGKKTEVPAVDLSSTAKKSHHETEIQPLQKDSAGLNNAKKN